MAGKSIEAGKAFLKLDVDEKAFDKKLAGISRKFKNAGRSIRAVGVGIGGFGAAITAPLALATKHFVTLGDQLNKMSARTVVGVKALSEFKFAAEQSGSSVESVEKGIRRMQQTVLDANQGLSTATTALSELGLTASDLNGLKPEDQFQKILTAVSAIEDPTRRAALSMDVFGRAGTELLPMAKDMGTLREEANRLGVTMSDKTAQKAADLADSMNRVKVSLGAAAVQIGSALAPMLVKLGNFLAVTIQHVTAFIEQHQTMVKVVAVAGASLVTIGGALATVGTILPAVTAGVGALVVAFGLLAANPVILALSLIAAAVAGIVGYIVSLGEETDKTSGKIKSAGRQVSQGAGSAAFDAQAKQVQAQAKQFNASFAASGVVTQAGASDVDRQMLSVQKEINQGIHVLVDLARNSEGGLIVGTT